MTIENMAPWEGGQDPPWPNPWAFQPVRRILRSSTAVVGKLYSLKMGGHVPHESIAERNFLRILEGIPAVWRYLVQPLKIPVPEMEGSSERFYTPDVLAIFAPPEDVTFRIAPLLFEIKPALRISPWVAENPRKVASSNALANARGWEYHIIGGLDWVFGQLEIASWVEEKSRAWVPAPLLQSRLLRSVKLWGPEPADELIRRHRRLGFPQEQIVHALNVLVLEGRLAPRLDNLGKWHLHYSDVQRQILTGNVS